MKILHIRELFLVILTFLVCCECEYLRATTNSYNIGFENINNRVNKTSPVGFENVHNRTSHHGSKIQHATTAKTSPIGFENVNNRTSHHGSKKQHPTTMKPSKPKGTERSRKTTAKPNRYTTKPWIPKGTVIPKKTTTRKSFKAKYTTTTTSKPTRPTLPPSIYVKPSISKVVVPSLQSAPWNQGWQKEPIVTTPTANNTSVLTPQNEDFTVFLMYLHDFTRKAEHNHQIKYKRHKGDTFNYYYEIYNYYQNWNLAAKNYRIPVDLLKNCQTNTSKVMCLPNTNAICLTNGTMMCVTHQSATIPCQEQTNTCAITYVPCDGRYQSCQGGTESFYAGIPCVSRVLLIPSSKDFYQELTLSSIEYCVTSVITPKRLYSPVGSLMSMLLEVSKHQYNMIRNSVTNVANNLLK